MSLPGRGPSLSLLPGLDMSLFVEASRRLATGTEVVRGGLVLLARGFLPTIFKAFVFFVGVGIAPVHSSVNCLVSSMRHICCSALPRMKTSPLSADISMAPFRRRFDHSHRDFPSLAWSRMKVLFHPFSSSSFSSRMRLNSSTVPGQKRRRHRCSASQRNFASLALSLCDFRKESEDNDATLDLPPSALLGGGGFFNIGTKGVTSVWSGIRTLARSSHSTFDRSSGPNKKCPAPLE
mmetsp:Transcript_42408/g.128163  ORF Transcript_42408/g.128163 Transcript_42408/m.128163 type:complete len:236 (+) Transcript_42408:205-912(+)